MKKIFLLLFLPAILLADTLYKPYQSLFDTNVITGSHLIINTNYQNFNQQGILLYGIKAGFTMHQKHSIELAYFQTPKSFSFSGIDTTIEKAQLSYVGLSSQNSVIHANGSLSIGIGKLSSALISDDFIYIGAYINTVLNLSQYIKVTLHFGYETSKGVDFNNQNDDSIGSFVGGIGIVYGNY